MSDDTQKQANPIEALKRALDPSIPKNEEGWAALEEIDRLRSRNEELEAALANARHALILWTDDPHGDLRSQAIAWADRALGASPPDSEPYKCRCPRCGDSFTSYEPHTPIQWKCPKCNVPLQCEPDSESDEGSSKPLLREPTDEERAKGIGAVTTRETDADELNEAIARGEPAEGGGDCLGCRGGSVHHTCGREPNADKPAQRQDAMLERREALRAVERLLVRADPFMCYRGDGITSPVDLSEQAKKDHAAVYRSLSRTSDGGGVAEAQYVGIATGAPGEGHCTLIRDYMELRDWVRGMFWAGPPGEEPEDVKEIVRSLIDPDEWVSDVLWSFPTEGDGTVYVAKLDHAIAENRERRLLEGWKLVPVEPTEDLLQTLSGWVVSSPDAARRLYARLLAAAPQPVQEGDDG